jgi:hypothetical protein
MENPTIGFESQFLSGFDLPDPGVDTIINTTVGAETQFLPGFDLPDPGTGTWALVNPTFRFRFQFRPGFDLLDPLPQSPDVLFLLNPTNNPEDPTQFSRKDSEFNLTYANWSPQPATSTNMNAGYFKNVGANTLGSVLSGVSGLAGGASVAAGLLGSSRNTITPYNTLKIDQLNNPFPAQYTDFRSRLTIGEAEDDAENVANLIKNLKVNGASAAVRSFLEAPVSSLLDTKSYRATAYAAASATPIGPYSIFNIKTLYGFGDHDAPGAIRSDFTARSLISTGFNRKTKVFEPTNNPIERAMPFRGDLVNAVDYGTRQNASIYRWKPKRTGKIGAKYLKKPIDLDAINNVTDKLGLGQTNDFIKFYFTGPEMSPGNLDESADVIVFRAIITSFDDSFSADWTSVQMVGRADPNYHYGAYSRGGSLSFDVYATDRDELKPIYRKLNALASYMAPIYDQESIAMIGPWMRLTVGDIHHQQPITLTSLTYNYGMDTPWEINIEEDPTMMQTPHRISVTCNFNIVGNDIPQNNGRILSLAKRYSSGSAVEGNDNWLSDFKSNEPKPRFGERLNN